jgi:4-hydroxy-tetrahydrodipicolinate reductase
MASEEHQVRVAVVGAGGRMGSEVCRAVAAADDLELVALVDRHGVGSVPDGAENAPAIVGDLDDVDWGAVDVAVEFTGPATVRDNVLALLDARVDVVVGATGMGDDDLASLSSAAAEAARHVFVAPNFAIGAVLMMQFAATAATHLPTLEIIELHHDGKVDAPSGTALRTAELVAEARREDPGVVGGDDEHPGARGFTHHGVPIHSVRLSGLVAHQEVIAGGVAETLTIRHDSLDRTSFMPGVLLAIRSVASQGPPLVVGLEHLL